MTLPRRILLQGGIAAVLSSALALPVSRFAAAAVHNKAKIGLIGAGQLGGTLGRLWAQAGHPVFFSSKAPDTLADLVREVGGNARAGTPEQAAEFADIVVLAVPYGALPSVGKALTPIVQGKPILDGCNPYVGRDGEIGAHALEIGAGLVSAGYFPGAHLVRGFNSLAATILQSQAHRPGEPMAIPLAGDDHTALQMASSLVLHAGFTPVIVGGLPTARVFQPGGPLFEKDLTASAMRAQLSALIPAK